MGYKNLFATRALEKVRTHLFYGEANVKRMGGYARLSDSFDGPVSRVLGAAEVLAQEGIQACVFEMRWR